MTRTAQIVALWALLLVSLPAFAQNPQAESDKKFSEGARLYHAGEYAAAILELKEGYRLAPHPVFLVNISLAYARLENWTEAAKFAHQATTETGLEPAASASTAARAHAWDARGQVESVVGNVVARRAQAEADAREAAEVPEPVPPAKGLGALGWVGVATGGVGAAAVGTSIAIGAMLQDDRRAYEQAGAAGDTAEYERLRDVIDRDQTFGQILLYSGAGLLALGTTLFVLDLTNERTAVAIGPGKLDFVWRW